MRTSCGGASNACGTTGHFQHVHNPTRQKERLILSPEWSKNLQQTGIIVLHFPNAFILVLNPPLACLFIADKNYCSQRQPATGTL
jgi:hypothetical protein